MFDYPFVRGDYSFRVRVAVYVSSAGNEVRFRGTYENRLAAELPLEPQNLVVSLGQRMLVAMQFSCPSPT